MAFIEPMHRKKTNITYLLTYLLDISDISLFFFLNENEWILIQSSLSFVSKGLIYNIQTLFLIMVWRWQGDKPLSEQVMLSSLTHFSATRQRVIKPAPKKKSNLKNDNT